MGKIITDILKITVVILLSTMVYGLFFNNDTKELGGGYSYYPDNEMILGDDIDIPPYIEELNYDKRFIIAKQNPRGRNPAAIFDRIDYKYPLGLDTIYYWIIDKQNHKYYGPITSDTFNETCKNLNIEFTFNTD